MEIQKTPRRNTRSRVSEKCEEIDSPFPKESLLTPKKEVEDKSILELGTTPRRSTRKSIKPAKDYDEIVGKRILRSNKKETPTKESSDVESNGNEHKWTPSEVGRFSQRRRRRVHKGTPVKKIVLTIEGDEDDLRKNAKEAAGQEEDKIVDHHDIEIAAIPQEAVICETVAAAPSSSSLKEEHNGKEEAKAESNDDDDDDMPSLQLLEDDSNSSVESNATYVCSETEPPALQNVNKELDDSMESNATYVCSETDLKGISKDDFAITVHPRPPMVPSILITYENGETYATGKPEPFKFEATEMNFKFNNSMQRKACFNLMPFDGTRKRSLSTSDVVIDEDATELRNNRVRFYSPANQTTFIEDIDIAMNEKFLKESLTFVTKRRKRSLSCDSIPIKPSKIPRLLRTPQKPKAVEKSPRQQRSKIPDFAAIHARRFEKMESIVDHVNRINERAKALTESAKKDKANREVLLSKNRTPVKARNPTHVTGLTPSKPSTSRQKLTPSKPTPSKRQQKLTPSKPQQKLTPAKPLQKRNESIMSLPNPSKILPLLGNATSSKLQLSKAVTYEINPTVSRRPAVNPSAQPANKLASRQEKFRAMAKGGRQAQRNEYTEYIKGVRSNKRFDLIMKARQNPEETKTNNK